MNHRQRQKSKGFGDLNNNLKKNKNSSEARNNTKETGNDGLFNSIVKPILDSGEIKKAEPTLRLLAQTGTKITEVYEALYKITKREEKEKELLHWHEKWLGTRSKRKDRTERQADEAKRLGLEIKYIEFMEQIFKIDSNDYENYLNLTDAYLRAENWTRAKSFILTSFNKPESNLEALWRLAWIEYESKNHGNSRHYLEKIINHTTTKKTQKNNATKITYAIELAWKNRTPTKEDLDYCNQLAIKQAKEAWPQNRILSTWLEKQHQNTELAYKLIEKAIEIQPKSHLLLKRKAILTLKLNKWSQGFEEILIAEKEKNSNSGDNPINILCDGSMGDSLLWSRYIFLINKQKTKNINLYVQPPLIPFMERNLKNVAEILPKTSTKRTKINNLGILAVPGLCEWKTELSEKLPLWEADQGLADEWRLRLKIIKGKPLIALNWHGSALKEAKGNQSTDIPLKAMNPSLHIKDGELQLIGVQKGIGSEEMLKCDFKDKFIPEQRQIKKMNSIEQLAGVLTLCDWLICDNSGPAHMASCLGIKTIVCLPENTDWRWPKDLESPPWYPNTIMIRKNINEEWESCLERAWQIINRWVISQTNHKNTTDSDSLY